jgi:hypothetical protein
MRKHHGVYDFATIDTAPPLEQYTSCVISQIDERIANHAPFATFAPHDPTSFKPSIFPTEGRHSLLTSGVDKVSASFNGFLELFGCLLFCTMDLFSRLLCHISGSITDIFGEIRNPATSSSPRLWGIEQCGRSSDHAPR